MISELQIRAAKIEDVQDLLDIYAYYVEHTAITYEYEVPTPEEFQDRMRHTMEKYPYLVAETLRGQIVGYAYAGPYHPRAAYGWNAEMTIYMDHLRRGYGTGKQMYLLLEDILKAQGIVNAIALITPPKTDADRGEYNSMHFHERMGYEIAGRVECSGYKFDQWFDTVTMVKRLGTPQEQMPEIKCFDDVREQFFL